MTTNKTNQVISLTLKRNIAASREHVFEAWTQADIVSQWFSPSDEFSINVPVMDLRVGGQYRIEMTNPEGNTHIAIGEYLEILEPEKLVFTWGWEGGDGGMLVTIELNEKDAHTELVLRHDKLPDKHSRDHHREGWVGCTDRLGKLLEQ
jgi:uncharacterized protein YndB with AHSA1/START domain